MGTVEWILRGFVKLYLLQLSTYTYLIVYLYNFDVKTYSVHIFPPFDPIFLICSTCHDIQVISHFFKTEIKTNPIISKT